MTPTDRQFRTLQQVELRDAAVRILHRAISHVLAGQQSEALTALQGPKAVEWYEDIGEYAALACFADRPLSAA